MLYEVITGIGDVCDVDADMDGVLNAQDLCPETQPNTIVNNNGCSSSQLDDDGDGIFNNRDICPNMVANAQVTSQGCPYDSLDEDNDGYSTADEFASGSNPWNPDSLPGNSRVRLKPA